MAQKSTDKAKQLQLVDEIAIKLFEYNTSLSKRDRTWQNTTQLIRTHYRTMAEIAVKTAMEI